jgi:uncharacterized protein YwqG
MTLDEIREALRVAGLERLADVAERLTLPAIRIEPSMVDEDTIPVGASKLGGCPDLPPNFIWPEWKGTGLTFLAQFRLSDLIAYDVEQLLPSASILYFFCEVEAQPWSLEPTDRDAWQVAFYDGESSTLQRTASPFPVDPTRSPAPHRLDYTTILTLPDYTLVEHFTGVRLSKDELNHYSDFVIAHSRWEHQMLGHAVEVQWPVQVWCEVGLAGRWFSEIQQPDRHLTPEGERLEAKAVQDWRLLLQLQAIDTTAIDAQGYPWEVDWGLGGMLYFCIRKDDLAQRRFSDTWLQLQTT